MAGAGSDFLSRYKSWRPQCPRELSSPIELGPSFWASAAARSRVQANAISKANRKGVLLLGPALYAAAEAPVTSERPYLLTKVVASQPLESPQHTLETSKRGSTRHRPSPRSSRFLPTTTKAVGAARATAPA